MLYLRAGDLINAFKYFKHTSDNKFEFKIKTLFICTIFFSIVYLFLDDLDFHGVNVVQEKIKDELIEKTVKKEINENVPEAFQNKESDTILMKNNNNNLLPDKTSDLKLEIATEEIKEEVTDEDLQAENIEPSLVKKFFNRVYFSINTGCLLGYGDIYPLSIAAKTLAMTQAFVTIMLILY